MAGIRRAKETIEHDGWSRSTVTTMGNILEVVTMDKTPFCPCRKVDKDHYIDLRTGELFDYEHSENRGENLDGMYKTMRHVQAVINTNVTDPDNCKWCTFTYGENMQDPERLYKDFKVFWIRFVRWCEKNGHGKPEYISVIEPQGRGAWHAHVMFIWQGKAPFISNDAVMSKLWGQGWTKTKAIKNCDNVGVYFSVYLADIPHEEFLTLPQDEQDKIMETSKVVTKEIEDDDGEKKEKRFVKGARLHFYPPGMNIIRTSKGIKPPTVEHMTNAEAKEKVSGATETFSRSYEIVDDSGNTINTITKRYYNRIRGKDKTVKNGVCEVRENDERGTEGLQGRIEGQEPYQEVLRYMRV